MLLCIYTNDSIILYKCNLFEYTASRCLAYKGKEGSLPNAHSRVCHLLLDLHHSSPTSQDALGAMSEPSQDSRHLLVPLAQLQASQALMLDAQAREKEAREREQELRDRIEQMQREMGKLAGELTALKAQRPRSWWARLFGGE
jgi:hypothetical protein